MASVQMPGYMEHMALEKYNLYYIFSRNQLFLCGNEFSKSDVIEDGIRRN